MTNFCKNIVGITIGIRYSRSFRIPDISGEIIDHVLYSPQTPFGAEFFPKIQENSAREKTLYNNKTFEYLRINTDDTILAIKTNNDFEEKFKWLKNNIIPYFKDDLFKNYKITNIKRFGVIFSHRIEKSSKISDVISLLTNDQISEANNISISFSKKNSVAEALVRKGVNDYSNLIFDLQEYKNSIAASFDYQHYYEPIIEDLRDCFTDKILEEASSSLKSSFYNWLSLDEKKQKSTI